MSVPDVVSVYDDARVHAAAVTRDYICHPRLGRALGRPYAFVDGAADRVAPVIDYRTLVGVRGPLVILDNVKVCVASGATSQTCSFLLGVPVPEIR